MSIVPAAGNQMLELSVLLAGKIVFFLGNNPSVKSFFSGSRYRREMGLFLLDLVSERRTTVAVFRSGSLHVPTCKPQPNR